MKKRLLAIPLAFGLAFGVVTPIVQDEPVPAHAANKYYFKNNVAKLTDVKIKITKVKFITTKQAFQYDCFSPLVLFEYQVTNLTGKSSVTPVDAWYAVFEVYQDNKNKYMNELVAQGQPYRKYDKTYRRTLKKGRTVKNAIIYELSDTKTPVLLKAYKGYDGTYLGKKTYKVKF